MAENEFDSILLVSFGGPEGPQDVIPFLENVLRGKNVPRERMLEVADHYQHFGGVSPINAQNRQLLVALKAELERRAIKLPVYWGNRNWHPLLADTLRQMQNDGKKHALAFFTSMFSSYSGCRQYRENIRDAQNAVGPEAPAVSKLRKAFNHPLFIEAEADCVREALKQLPSERAGLARLLFAAHSIPLSMADNCSYVQQLHESARLVAEAVGSDSWEVVYQSRSGPPSQPWLEPDVSDRIEQLAAEGIRDFVIVPIGFVSDHIEVLYDLDTEARAAAVRANVGMVRASTVGDDPRFVQMIGDLIDERLTGRQSRAVMGNLPVSHDVCPENCCLYPQTRRPVPSP